MDPRVVAALRREGLITFAEALAHGGDPRDIARQVRTGQWVRLRRGVYAEASVWAALDRFTEQPVLRVRAAQLTLTVPHRFSHDSAALLHGIGAPDPQRCLVHVTRRRVTGGRVESGIKHHQSPYLPEDRAVLHGLPALGLARTAVDLVREHGLAGGLPAVDQALRRGVSRDDLEVVLRRMRSWPGSRAMRAAVELGDPGSESWLESEGRLFVIELGLGVPETQFGLTDGTRTAFADLRLGRHLFEIDGRAKYRAVEHGGLADDPDAALWREKVRRDFLLGFGLGLSRLTAVDLHTGQAEARLRVLREYAATRARFGDDISDLERYRVRRRPA